MNEKLRQIFENGLGDAKVQTISWTDENLAIDLVLPNVDHTTHLLCLCFETVSHLQIEMNYGDYIGKPLLFSAEVNKCESDAYIVKLEFGAAPEGLISFECNAIVELHR